MNVSIDEITSWLRLEFYYQGRKGGWQEVTEWRVKHFAGGSEIKYWNNQSWECEGAYDGDFRAQAYAKAYLSNGAVLRFPEGSGYATSAVDNIDC